MSVINRRNALFGYAALKVLERRRKQRRRSMSRIALYVGLGIVSAGVLAGLMAVLVRRHRGDAVDRVESFAEGEIVGEQVAAEPLPAA